MKFDKNQHEYYSKLYEGGLFSNIEFHRFKDTFVIKRRLYVVKGGVVYIIEKDNSLYPTGDDLFNIYHECKRVGKYNPAKKYKIIKKEISYAELMKMLKPIKQ